MNSDFSAKIALVGLARFADHFLDCISYVGKATLLLVITRNQKITRTYRWLSTY